MKLLLKKINEKNHTNVKRSKHDKSSYIINFNVYSYSQSFILLNYVKKTIKVFLV